MSTQSPKVVFRAFMKVNTYRLVSGTDSVSETKAEHMPIPQDDGYAPNLHFSTLWVSDSELWHSVTNENLDPQQDQERPVRSRIGNI